MTDTPAPATDQGASALSEAVATLAAVATSLNETNTKLTSVTENLSKVAEGVAGQANTADSARSIDNVYSVGSVEAVRAASARFVQDYAGEALESVKRSRNFYDKMVSDLLSHDNDVRSIISRGLSNSTESDNMISKNSVDFARMANAQTVRHADTQLFETSMGEGTEVSGTAATEMGQAVNALLAVAESLNAVASQLAKTATPAKA